MGRRGGFWRQSSSSLVGYEAHATPVCRERGKGSARLDAPETPTSASPLGFWSVHLIPSSPFCRRQAKRLKVVERAITKVGGKRKK